MRKPLRVLLIEDSEIDAELLLRILRKGGYEPIHQRIETAEELRSALDERAWDILLADYNLPQFSAPDALALLHESKLDLPFIVVSGGIGEDTAVAAMKAGAHDYLMKGNLARLVPAVERELREAENRAGRRATKRALEESELRYRLLWETATDAIILIDTEGRIHFANPAMEEVFGYKPDEVIGQKVDLLQPEQAQSEPRNGLSQYLQNTAQQINWRVREARGLRKDGSEVPVEVAFSHMELNGSLRFVGFYRDITERKRAERELQQSKEQLRVAREIQQHLFPKSPPHLPGFEVAGASLPAELTGGDYFDYLPMLQDRIGFVVGDVTGHGVGPAMLMAETRAYLRILARNRDNLSEILSRANIVLAEDVGYERFVTLFLAQIDPLARTLTYANAGHPPGFILAASGEIKARLARTGMPLGLHRNGDYASGGPYFLAPGDVVLLLTDGFEEALSLDERMFGIESTLEAVRQSRHKSAEDILRAIYDSVQEFSKDAEQEDDLTAIVIKCLP